MKIAEKITQIIDVFYIKPVRRFLPRQTFRYAVCGGVNLVLNWLNITLDVRIPIQNTSLTYPTPTQTIGGLRATNINGKVKH